MRVSKASFVSLAIFSAFLSLESNQFEKQSRPEIICGKPTMRVSARHIEAGGVGYQNGYTSLEGFFAWDTPHCQPFLDLRGHIFNNKRMAANAGIGIRGIWKQRVYGSNVYYDYRNTNRFHYNQIGVGLETLGELWDLRINGYLPVGAKKSDPFSVRFGQFFGHNFSVSQKYEFSMKGADLEAGFHFGKTENFDFYAAAGPYYFVGEIGGATWGGKARISGSYRDYITAEFSNSLDHTFHYRPQGQVTFSWPFGPRAKKNKAENYCALANRMIQPVGRQEIIVVNRKRRDSVAIDPATGKPFFLLFVNNQSHSAGTFESPYPTLAEAENNSKPGDIIYVYPGDGTTTGMDGGILLKPDQKFFGSGIAQTLVTNQGTITIPAQSSTLPNITNVGGSAVTLANGVEVSGFLITEANTYGVAGTNVTGVTVANSTIMGSQGTLASGDGVNIYADDGLFHELVLNNLTATNNGNNGIYVATSGTTSANITISNCFLAANGFGSVSSSNAVTNGIVLNAADTSNMTAQLESNSVLTNQQYGIVLDSSSNGRLSFSMKENLIEGHSFAAIHAVFTGTAGSADVLLTENNIVGNWGKAPDHLGGFSLPVCFFSFHSPATFSATNNHLDLNTGSALWLEGGAAAFSAAMNGNTMNQNCNNGFAFRANGSDPIDLVLQNNEMSQNCSNGIYIDSDGSNVGEFSIALLNNTIFGNDNGIFYMAVPNITSMNLNARDNEMNGNGGGIYLSNNFDNRQTVTVNLIGNTINGNCDGVNFTRRVNVQTLTANIIGNTINGNCGDFTLAGYGCNVQTLTTDIIGNTFNGNCGAFYVMRTGDGHVGVLTANVNDNKIIGNYDGINFDCFSNTSTMISMSNNEINGNAGSGIYTRLSSTGRGQIILDGNTFNGNCGSGIAEYSDNIDLIVKNNTIRGNCGNFGASLTLQNGDLVMDNNVIQDNDGGGVALYDVQGDISFSNNQVISNFAGHGLVFSNNQPRISQLISLINNNFSYNYQDGVFLGAPNNSLNSDFIIKNNVFSYNGGHGIRSGVNTGSLSITANTILEGNRAYNNGSYGIFIEAADYVSFVSVKNNTLFNNNLQGTSDMFVLHRKQWGGANPFICLEMTGNTSNRGYLLQNNEPTFFNLAPLNVNAVNVGTITESGIINHVSSCP